MDRVDPWVLSTAGENGSTEFLVFLREQASLQAAANAATKEEKGELVTSALRETAARTQAPVLDELKSLGAEFRPYWIANMIWVRGDLEVVRLMAERPEVLRVSANPTVALKKLPPDPQRDSEAPSAVEWGIIKTKADQVWALGIEGLGVVVGGQDTGIEWDHPALQEAYRGWNASSGTPDHVYNWVDAFPVRDAGDLQVCAADPQIPCDDHGHGTHTMGTMLGDATLISDTIIGMAPDAQWIGCRNMRRNDGTPASYTACFEFMLAPYPQGEDPATAGRPELGAHVVNNSWGCPPSEGCDAGTLQGIVETARAAGIVVVASAGNAGAACSSVLAPIGLYDAALTVGAVNNSNAIAAFSSRGPVTVDGSGRRKPDIVAPGVGVRSAVPGGSVQIALSGTSMAAPHVAGAVALLWSAAPGLIGDVDATEQILLRSATPNPATAGCDGGGAVWPNNITGFGSLNALAAVLTARQPATVTLAFRSGDGRPVTVTHAALVDPLTGYTVAAAELDGDRALWPQVYAGTYAVTARDRFGSDLGIDEHVAVTRSATISQSLTVVIEVRAFYPLIFR